MKRSVAVMTLFSVQPAFSFAAVGRTLFCSFDVHCPRRRIRTPNDVLEVSFFFRNCFRENSSINLFTVFRCSQLLPGSANFYEVLISVESTRARVRVSMSTREIAVPRFSNRNFSASIWGCLNKSLSNMLSPEPEREMGIFHWNREILTFRLRCSLARENCSYTRRGALQVSLESQSMRNSIFIYP